MTPEAIAGLLQPYVAGSAVEADWPRLYAQLAAYLELILKWNARTNLTAVRLPEEIVRRHFGESLFAGLQLGTCPTLLDFGSGAGFPGIPIQLLRPGTQVTLAESQGKKASFLREAVRTLELDTEVWAGRVEAMPEARTFHTVALRAVDAMESAVRHAATRARERVLILTTRASCSAHPAEDFPVCSLVPLPETLDGIVWVGSRAT
jgi:16S rRNA (guanine527-N7)-methyltransferase